MTFQSAQSCHVEAAKRVIKEVWQEILGDDPCEAVRKYPETRLTDLDDLNANYFLIHGIFVVVIDHDEVVGTGAIRRINSDVCELKRVFLLDRYRNKGIGFQLIKRLLCFAKDAGYKQICLGTNKKFFAAHNLYRRMEFCNDPERLDPSGRTIYMKLLF